VKAALALLFATSCTTAALACDKVDAAKVQRAFAEAGASWTDRAAGVALEWGWAWDGAPAARRLALLKAFAAGDECLTGAARPISFYRNGRLVGTASAAGVHLVGVPATSAGARSAGPDCR